MKVSINTDGASQVVLVVKTLPANRRRKSLEFNPWVRKIPRWKAGNPLHHSCLENSMDRGAWWAMIHGVAKSRTRLCTQHLFDWVLVVAHGI